MKRLATVLGLTAILTLFTPSVANATEGCVINVLGIRVCGELLGQPLPPVVTVTVRPDPIRIPGPTVTLPAPPAATVHVPGPTVTVTANSAPVGPSELPQPTKTVTESTAGQTTTSRATVSASPETEVKTKTETQTKTETIVRKVFLGTLVSLALALLGLIAMLVGYYFGRKDEERKEEGRLGQLLDYAKTGKRPDTK